MKNILLLVHDDPAQESRLQVALDVTRWLGGHLECLAVRELPMLSYGDYSAAEAMAMMDRDDSTKGSLQSVVEDRLAGEDVAWSCERSFEARSDALNYASDFADLIVMSSRLDEVGDKLPTPERLPLRSGRPILAVPPGTKGLDLGAPVVIAWDGSRPAVEAVRAAARLSGDASEVVLIEVDPPSGALAMEEAAVYLSRHGITPHLIERDRAPTVADTLLDQIRLVGAGFLAMGAYGSPPSAERIFGGVTRTMLQRSPVPLLLAH
ncbi:universal stress protein [Erythrobacter sp.]|uniref:universal stress protein n=1 Tax=Erythrobacter sp. TaxID=1042 RepID=UPI001425C8DF|nr:universal stress protein [Erythrobacter sp.]QIQ85692.1 MAG: universal stress protein [Erythrobacter sp.]